MAGVGGQGEIWGRWKEAQVRQRQPQSRAQARQPTCPRCHGGWRRLQHALVVGHSNVQEAQMVGSAAGVVGCLLGVAPARTRWMEQRGPGARA